MTQNFRRWTILLSVLATFGLIVGFHPLSAEAYPFVSISEIQGDGFTTPYNYQYVETTGIVTADYQYESKRGYFIQDPVGDGDPATSEGLFVYDRYDSVSLGDEVLIAGRITEYDELTEMGYTQYCYVLSSDNPLPEPVELNPPSDDTASDIYYEALECMLVTVSEMDIVAGTDVYGEAAGVVADSDIDHVFRDDPAGTGEIIFTDDAGGYVLNVRTGNVVKGLVGPLDYTYDEYKILPVRDAQIEVIPKGSGIGLGRGRAETRGISIASYNMFNLFESGYGDVEVKLAKHALTIREYLREPDLIAVQEVENPELLELLANTPPIIADYGVVLIEGPDSRGIDVGLLYRTDKISIISYEARQTTTDLDDGYGPGGGLLFSRPPLVVHLEILGKGKKAESSDLWVIVNHFKSKSVYAPYYADTTPRRVEQAAWVGSLVDEIQVTDPDAQVIVIGDLNDFEDSEPIQTLVDGGLHDLIYDVDKEDRYTYIYRGVSQVLDHILITPSLEEIVNEVMVFHSNIDFPNPLYGEDPTIGIRSSDHDLLLAGFDI
ncbi:MAG: endonuclease/exonuclease/phosphatase family protein [Promethearchaeota archaeon]